MAPFLFVLQGEAGPREAETTGKTELSGEAETAGEAELAREAKTAGETSEEAAYTNNQLSAIIVFTEFVKFPVNDLRIFPFR